MNPVLKHRCGNPEFEVGCEVELGVGTRCVHHNSPITHLFPDVEGGILFQSYEIALRTWISFSVYDTLGIRMKKAFILRVGMEMHTLPDSLSSASAAFALFQCSESLAITN